MADEGSECHQGDNEGTHPAILSSPKKMQSILEAKLGAPGGRPRERSTSHCFGAEEIKQAQKSLIVTVNESYSIHSSNQSKIKSSVTSQQKGSTFGEG
jgi:hypothetical protein